MTTFSIHHTIILKYNEIWWNNIKIYYHVYQNYKDIKQRDRQETKYIFLVFTVPHNIIKYDFEHWWQIIIFSWVIILILVFQNVYTTMATSWLAPFEYII